MAVDGSDQIRLTENRYHDVDPVWSPDGSRIAFLSNRLPHEDDIDEFYKYGFKLYTMAADGSDVRNLAPGVSAMAGVPPVWSPDGRRIAFVSNEKVPGDKYPYAHFPLHVVGTDGSDPIRVSVTASRPAWSPDGQRLAFVKSTPIDGRVPLRTINPDGSGLREVSNIDLVSIIWHSWGRHFWSPDGSEIRYGGYPVFSANSDGSAVQLFGGRFQATALAAAWSPNSSRVAVSVAHTVNAPDSDREVVLFSMERDGSDKRILLRAIQGEDELQSGEGRPWEPAGGWGPRSEALDDQPGEPLLAHGPRAVEPCTALEESTASCQERDVGDVNLFDAGWGGAGYDVDLDVPSVEEISEKGMMHD